MRKTLGISLLILLLASSASAGIMPNLSPAPQPEPTPATAVQEPTDETTTDGEIQNDAPDGLTQIALDLLALLPSLL